MLWLDKILGRNKSVDNVSVRMKKESSEITEVKKEPVTTILRDDSEFFISKTTSQKEKDRTYEIRDKERDIQYVMDIKHGQKNILVNVTASQGDVSQNYSRGAKVQSNPEESYAVECNFLSILKKNKDRAGELISSLLVLTSDEICDAPKKRYPERREAKAQKRAEAKAARAEEKAAKLRQQLEDAAFLAEHGISRQEMAEREQKARQEAIRQGEQKIGASVDKILALARAKKSKGSHSA